MSTPSRQQTRVRWLGVSEVWTAAASEGETMRWQRQPVAVVASKPVQRDAAAAPGSGVPAWG